MIPSSNACASLRVTLDDRYHPYRRQRYRILFPDGVRMHLISPVSQTYRRPEVALRTARQVARTLAERRARDAWQISEPFAMGGWTASTEGES